jgi:hypothetical protein
VVALVVVVVIGLNATFWLGNCDARDPYAVGNVEMGDSDILYISKYGRG